LRVASLHMIQLHGSETPERVVAVRKLTGLPIIKAVGVSVRQDISAARLYESVADFLLLDAKPPTGGLPGGNAAVFDWSLLQRVSFAKPWLLAGGLDEANIEAAAATTGARILDVSSGVEDAQGHKSPAKITAFLNKAAKIRSPSA